jgi:DNA polymerase-3 subunit delta'
VRAVAPEVAEGNDAALAAALAEGSPRRFIELMRENGIELYRLMRRGIEADDQRARFKLSALAWNAAGTARLQDLYEGYLSRRLRGVPEPGEGRSLPAVPLVTLADLWDKAAFSGREVETYNLDRRQFVLDLLESSAAALRQAGSPSTA